MRWSVSPTQLAAAVVETNVRPSPRSMLPRPDASAAHRDGSAGPIGAERGVMTVLADPIGRLTVVLDAPGREGRAAPSLYWHALAGPFVLVVETSDGLELEQLPTLNDVALWLDATMMLTAIPAQTAPHCFQLSLAGYAALLAVADAVEVTRLRRLLERVTGPAPALTIGDVHGALVAGITHDHAGWVVSAARAVCPADFAAAAPNLPQGLGELAGAGLITLHGTDVGITRGGAGLIATIGRPLRTAGVARAASARDDSIGVAHLTVHRGVSSIWVALWTSLGDDPACSLVQCSAARAATVLIDLIRV